MSINFSCTSIFCDDIRYELNGKMSLMGIYNSVMYVPDFPITLPKICSYCELRIPPDLNDSTDAVLTVMKGAEKINSVSFTLPSADASATVSHGKPFAFNRAVGALEFPSMTFSEATLLEVTAQIDGQSVVGGRLWVTKFPEADLSATTKSAE